MNTIKIYLAESGRIADLRKDFPLYQGQFQSKLLNVYVPTSIMAPEFTSSDSNNNTLKDYVASTSVKIGMTYTARNGAIKTSKNYYMRYLKTLTQNGVEYALYERKLPKEFTLYAGEGANAPVLVANVVNILQDTETGKPEILSITATQTCPLDVMPSTDLDNDEAIEPTELENLNAEINAINDTLIKKQDKEDFRLETINKTVVGAINENKNNIEINTATAQANAELVADLKNQIDELSNRTWQQENYVGQMSGETLPSNLLLNNFVRNTLARDPQNADVVIFVLRNGEASRTYKYTYYDNGWAGYQLTVISRANNTTYGTIRGTFGTDDDNGVLLDISDGEVQHIWIKDAAENYRDLHEYLATTNQSIADIINGQTTVGTALKAVEDQLGRNIVDTYLTKIDGATKNFVRDYAMPREFSTVYFISRDGYVTKAPTTPESGIQFTEMVDNVGTYELFNLSRTLDADFELTISNGYQNNIFISVSESCDVEFILTTEYKKQGDDPEDWQVLNVEKTPVYSFVVNENQTEDIQKITFSSPFVALGDSVLQLSSGDLIRQRLEVDLKTVVDVVFDVISNDVYPSIFTLTSQNYIAKDVQSVIGQTLVLGMDGIVEGNNAIFTVQNSNDFVEYLTNQRQFLGILSLPLVGELSDDLLVKIKFGDTTYDLYSYEKGAVVPLTIGDLRSVMDYNTNIGYSFFPELYFIYTNDIQGFALVPSTITADQLINILGEDGSVLPHISGKKIDFSLSAELTSKLMRALLTPVSAPTETEIVAIDSAGNQVNLELGQGIQINDGKLEVSVDVTGTVVTVDGEPVNTFDADTKADLTNDQQTIVAGRLEINDGALDFSEEGAGIYMHGERPRIILEANEVTENTGAGYSGLIQGDHKGLSIVSPASVRLNANDNVEISTESYFVLNMADTVMKGAKILFVPGNKDLSALTSNEAQISYKTTTDSLEINRALNITNDLSVSGAITSNGDNVVVEPSLLNFVYPVGSIYLSVQGVSPASFLGGTWEQLPANYALWTATSGAGGTISAGLPNITGKVEYRNPGNTGDALFNEYSEEGAFEVNPRNSSTQWNGGLVVEVGPNKLSSLLFDASKSNSLYGGSSTVQPPAYKIYAWKRTA